jgi:hypothetical protein
MAYCRMAMRLGGMRLQHNELTQRTDILYAKKTSRTSMATKWSLYVEAASEGRQPAAAKTAAEETERAEPATPQKGQASTAKAKAKARGLPTSSTNKEAGPAEKDNQKALRNATAAKALYNKVCTVQRARLEALQNDEEWACLRTDTNVRELKRLRERVMAEASKPFAMQFLDAELVDIKKRYKDDLPGFFFQCETAGGPADTHPASAGWGAQPAKPNVHCQQATTRPEWWCFGVQDPSGAGQCPM